jgi:hypothetical protein
MTRTDLIIKLRLMGYTPLAHKIPAHMTILRRSYELPPWTLGRLVVEVEIGKDKATYYEYLPGTISRHDAEPPKGPRTKPFGRMLKRVLAIHDEQLALSSSPVPTPVHLPR